MDYDNVEQQTEFLNDLARESPFEFKALLKSLQDYSLGNGEQGQVLFQLKRCVQ